MKLFFLENNYLNLKYFKCHAEDIDECINYFNIAKKNIILVSIGALEYVNSFFLEEFFLKLKKYQSLNLFLVESVNLKFIDSKKEMTKHRGNISFSHRYDEYVKKSGLNIIEYKLTRPYSENDKLHSDTGHFNLHASN